MSQILTEGVSASLLFPRNKTGKNSMETDDHCHEESS
jgi:hypothetical protein